MRIRVLSRRSVSLLLIVLLFTISPLAYWETPDPVWLPGYYDAGDQDEAIANLELRHLSSTDVLVVDASPLTASVQLPSPSSERVPPDHALPATPTRAPPIA